MTYDRVDWHDGDEYPADLPPENCGTHIGMFVGWAMKRGFAGELFVEESAEALADLRRGALSGRDFLMDECDGKFWDDVLDDEGKRFADAYYEERYFADYAGAVDADALPTIYHVENSPENQRKVEAMLDERYAGWKQGPAPQPPGPKPVPDSPSGSAPAPIPPPKLVSDDPGDPRDPMTAVIPTGNPAALWGYYTGVFSFIPGVGLLLGPTAVWLGLRGLRAYRERPQRRGRVHAFVAIGLGGFTLLLHVGAIIAIVVN